jgi:hypothetical protein
MKDFPPACNSVWMVDELVWSIILRPVPPDALNQSEVPEGGKTVPVVKVVPEYNQALIPNPAAEHPLVLIVCASTPKQPITKRIGDNIHFLNNDSLIILSIFLIQIIEQHELKPHHKMLKHYNQ